MTQGGSNLACAVCKFQRRKCKPDCLLARYFPGDQPRLFHNVHRLFGVSNMLKILEGLHPSQHAIAMQTMIDEANMRIWYPIHGCLGVIHNLKAQIQILEDEIRAVYLQLVIYRQKMATLGVTGDVGPPKTDPDNKYVDGGTCHGAAIQVASTVLQKIEQEGTR